MTSPATTTKMSEPAINGTAFAASAPPAISSQNRMPIGTSVASATAPTRPIGISRSTTGRSPPAFAADDAASAERMPANTGPMMRSNVQIAATPITPAPRKRTSAEKTVFATCSAEPLTVLMAVRIGSATHQPMARPTSIAMPTDSPTRWPAPRSANERLPEMPVAPPAPLRNHSAASPATSFIWAASANAAEAKPLTRITASPAALSAAPSREPAPTLSTSAAARPSGYGRSVSTTSARRSGTENITPSRPPVAQITAVVTKSKPCHQPIITSPGSTKMIADSVPAAEATVWTMLFSRIVESEKTRRTAIEITAAGIEVANVRPTFSPR